MGTTITLDKSEYDQLQAQITNARAGEAKARDELLAERTKPVDERLAALTEFNVAAKEIIDYAVANLSPEFARGWPTEAMDVVARGVTTFGAVTSRDEERAVIWRQFAEQIRDFDRRWALAMLAINPGASAPESVSPVDHPDDPPPSKMEHVPPSVWAFIAAAICFVVLAGGLLALRC